MMIISFLIGLIIGLLIGAGTVLWAVVREMDYE